jgi:hypothetical protein
VVGLRGELGVRLRLTAYGSKVKGIISVGLGLAGVRDRFRVDPAMFRVKGYIYIYMYWISMCFLT